MTSVLHNIQSSLFLAVSFEVEEVVGSVGLLVFYFSMGVAGWICTAFSNYLRFPKESGWQWISSCGASPSTYGLAFWCSVSSPHQQLPPLRSWALLLLYFAICGHSAFVKWHLLTKTTASISSLLMYSAFIIITFTSSVYVVTNGELTTVAFLVIYLTVTFVYRAFNLMCLGGSLKYPSSDNGAHLGGALCGLMLGICWHGVDEGCVGVAEVHLPVWLCAIYLILRCYFNF